jgi:hypothetical protein
MYSSQSGSYEMGNTKICHSCGSVTIKHEEKAITKKKGITYVVLGWMFFAISLLFLPIIFGVGSLFMGIMTFCERSQVHGAILIFFAAAGLILGSLFSFMVSGTLFI